MSLAALSLKRSYISAALLAIAALSKGPPILMVVYFVLFRKDLGYLARFLMSASPVVLASSLVVPYKLYAYYLVNVAPAPTTAFSMEANESVVGLLSRSHLSELTPTVTFAGYMAFAAFAVHFGRQARALGQRALRDDTMFLMNVLVILLFEPRTSIYPYVWIILPAALFLSTIMADKVSTYYLLSTSLATALLNANVVPASAPPSIIVPIDLAGNALMTLTLALVHVRLGIVSCK